ncbi:MAG: 2-keto-4-pentenoate hydratase [Chloroflexota bacterium]
MDARQSIKKRWHEALSQARRDKVWLDSLAQAYGELSIDEAYEVQAMLLEERRSLGDRLIGWKVAATSERARATVKVSEPFVGFMTGSWYVPTGQALKASDYGKLAVEGEIAFVMREGLHGPGLTTADVYRATLGVMAGVEVVDSRVKDWKVNAAEAVADNALHAGVLLGPFMRTTENWDPVHEGVVASVNGRVVGSGCGAEALGNPAEVLVWLANKLSKYGQHIEPGHIILTGTVAPAQFVKAGDVVSFSYTSLGRIELSVE